MIFTVDKATSWIEYCLDGQSNVIIAGNTTLSSLSEGGHNIVVYANSTSGYIGKSNTVYFAIHIPKPPVANFSWSPLIPKVGETVTFDGTSSTSDGTAIVSYVWSFGDGQAVSGSNAIVTHSYASEGSYNATLNVTDGNGLWDAHQEQVEVTQQYNITFGQMGVGSDFAGTVLTIDGTNCTASDLPMSFWWDNGSSHTFAFQSPLVVNSEAKEYDWTSTSGLSMLQSDSITITGSGSVTGNYVTRVHDVAVTNVSINVPHCSSKVGNGLWVFQGLPVYVNVTALNKGDFDENVTVTLYYNSTSSNSAKGISSPNILLSAGQTQTIVLVWNTTAIPYCLNYTITAVATIPTDNNPADNSLSCGPTSVRIMGDINGDGKVDGKDLGVVALSFASYGPDYLYLGSAPSPRWNLDCDINGDNKIDGKDLGIIALNFGK